MRRILLTRATKKQALFEALRVLRTGGVVAYPTETAYALGVDATKKNALKKIYNIKGRDQSKLLSVLMANLAMAREYAMVPRHARMLWRRFLPGPLTLILPSKQKSIGMRVSSHPFAAALVRVYGRPITATSANRSHTPPLRSGAAIAHAFFLQKYQPDLIIDAGLLPKRLASTVVDCTGSAAHILRKGPIKELEIKKALQL